MNIEIEYDSSVNNAPAGFKAAVQAAVAYFDRLFANNVTVPILFSYGELTNQSLDASALGESKTNGNLETYANLVNYLNGQATSPQAIAAVGALAATDPTSGGRFWVSDTQAAVFGLGSEPGYTDPENGFVALGSNANFTYAADNRSVAGAYDAIGVLEHEISEALGRINYLGTQTFEGYALYSPMDLFRYTSAGVPDLTNTAGYFSLDGQTMLMAYNDPNNGGDAGDWAGTTANDAFNAFTASGQEKTVSLVDIEEMNALGFTIATPTANDFASPGTSAGLMINSNGAMAIATDVSGSFHYASIGSIGKEWTIVGEGNFLGDSYSEFALHNTNGALVIGEYVNNKLTYTSIGALGSEWAFEGSGYFTDTQYADLLLHNSAGALVLAQVVNGTAQYTTIGGLGPEWQFEAVGDFGGETTYSEFLIRNSVSGALDIGQVQNGKAVYTQIGAVGSEWEFEGAGDFYGQGRDEFVMRNMTTGAVVLGDLNNGALSYKTIGYVGAEWKFIDVGDYLGPQSAGFLMENTGGSLVLGTVVHGAATYHSLGAVGSTWSLYGSGAAGRTV